MKLIQNRLFQTFVAWSAGEAIEGSQPAVSERRAVVSTLAQVAALDASSSTAFAARKLKTAADQRAACNQRYLQLCHLCDRLPA